MAFSRAVVCGPSWKPGAGGQKSRDDRERFRSLREGLRRIAQEERQYCERQCRWLIRQHSRAQSSIRKFVEESMAPDAAEFTEREAEDGEYSQE